MLPWIMGPPFWTEKDKTPELIPSREALAVEEANQKFYAEKGEMYPIIVSLFSDKIDITAIFLFLSSIVGFMFAIIEELVFGVKMVTNLVVLLNTSLFSTTLFWLMVVHPRRFAYNTYLNQAKQYLLIPYNYYERAKSLVHKRINAVGGRGRNQLIAELDRICKAIEDAKRAHPSDCANNCDLCRAIADANKLKEYILSLINNLYVEERNLLTRTDNFMDKLAEREQKQITEAGMIKELEVEWRREVDGALMNLGSH